MPYQAKNGTLAMAGRSMDYISFGGGDRPLIMLPGLSDGLKTVKGAAAPFAWMYRAFAKEHKVYVLSRINQLAEGYTTGDMARDTALAMDALGLASARVYGVSQGGMIAQRLALDYPERVERLALAVTASRSNPMLTAAVTRWICMAQQGDYKGLMVDTAESSYSDAYMRTHRWLFPLLGSIGGPKEPSRFILQAQACLSHDAYARLPELRCPTLILGGGADRIVGPQASKELAERIPGSELYIYQGLGHAAYEEAGDFNSRVLRFLEGAARG